MTAGNLLCGFSAIFFIFEGTLLREAGGDAWTSYYRSSLFCILGAFIFDILDGRLARLGGQESAFGREFDSLADMVSFGVAPAFLVGTIILEQFPNSETNRLGWMIAALYLTCGGLRLARYNVLASQPDGSGLKDFRGFPIPAAAGLIASITLLMLYIYEHDRDPGNGRYLLAGLMVFLSFMMFSNVKYPSFKRLDWRTRRPIPKLLGFILLIGLIINFYQIAIAAVFTVYLLYGFLRPFVSRHWRSQLEDEDE